MSEEDKTRMRALSSRWKSNVKSFQVNIGGAGLAGDQAARFKEWVGIATRYPSARRCGWARVQGETNRD